MLLRLHGELLGGGDEEAVAVLNSLVCRGESSLEHPSPGAGAMVSDCHPQMVSERGSSPGLVLRKDSC